MLPPDLAAELETELRALARLEGTEGVVPEYLHVCQAVARAQASARASIRACPAEPEGGGPATERRLARGDVRFDVPVLRRLLRDLEGWAGAVTPRDQLRGLAAAADADPGLLRDLAAAAAFDDDTGTLDRTAHRLGIPAPSLRFVGQLLAAPFVQEARRRRGSFAERDARDGGPAEACRCPSCGSPPALAVLEPDAGRRRLACGLCGDTWLAPRLMCAACGTRDQSRLVTLSLHQGDVFWVEACDACGRYLKTVDQRRLVADQAWVLRAADAASLHLDLLADDAGYERLDRSRNSLIEMTS